MIKQNRIANNQKRERDRERKKDKRNRFIAV